MCINHGGARHKAVSLSPAQCSGWPDADGTSTHMYVRDAGLTLFESLFALGEGGFLRESERARWPQKACTLPLCPAEEGRRVSPSALLHGERWRWGSHRGQPAHSPVVRRHPRPGIWAVEPESSRRGQGNWNAAWRHTQIHACVLGSPASPCTPTICRRGPRQTIMWPTPPPLSSVAPSRPIVRGFYPTFPRPSPPTDSVHCDSPCDML